MNIFIVNEEIAYEGQKTLRVCSSKESAMNGESGWIKADNDKWFCPQGTINAWEKTVMDEYEWLHIYEVEILDS